MTACVQRPLQPIQPTVPPATQLKKQLPTVEEGCREILRRFMTYVRHVTAIQQDTHTFNNEFRTYRADGSVVGVNIVSLSNFITKRWDMSHSHDPKRIERFTLKVLGMACEQPKTIQFALFVLAVHPGVGQHATLNHPLRCDPATGALRSKHNFALTSLQGMTTAKAIEALTPKVLDPNNVLYRFVGAYLQGSANCNEQPHRTLDTRPPIPGISPVEDARILLVNQIVCNLQEILNTAPRVAFYPSDLISTGELNTLRANERLPYSNDAVYLLMTPKSAKINHPSVVKEYAALSLSDLAKFKFSRKLDNKLSKEDLEALAHLLVSAKLTFTLFYRAALKLQDRSLHFGPQNADYANAVDRLIDNNPMTIQMKLFETPFFRELLARMGVTCSPKGDPI